MPSERWRRTGSDPSLGLGDDGGSDGPSFDPRPPSRRDRSPDDDRDQTTPGSRSGSSSGGGSSTPAPEPAPEPPSVDPVTVDQPTQRERDLLRGRGDTIEVPAADRDRSDLRGDAVAPSDAERDRIADGTRFDADEIAGIAPRDDGQIDVLPTDAAVEARARQRVDTQPDFDPRPPSRQARDGESFVGPVFSGDGDGDGPFLADVEEDRLRDMDEELRAEAAADDPLRDADDFVVEDGEVRPRAAPFFESQREALGFDTPDESPIRRRLQETSGAFSAGARGELLPADRTTPGSAARELTSVESPLIGADDDIRTGGAEVFNVPGAILSGATVAEQAADLGQAEATTRRDMLDDAVEETRAIETVGDVDDVTDPFGMDVPEGSAAADERAATRAAAEQTVGTVGEIGRERPGLLVGGAVAGTMFGIGAGRVLDAPGAAIRSTRVRRAADDRIDFDDLQSPTRGDTELPQFETSPSAPTAEAVSEVQRRARQADESVAADGGALFHTTEARMRGELEVGEGMSELPGIFTSPDPSPLGLAEGASAGTASLRPRAPRPLRTDTDQIVALPGDDIRGMPTSAQGAAYAVRGPDGELVETGLTRGQARALASEVDGERAPDPTTGGYQFLTEDADPSAAFVRPQGGRTTELEAIFPPGGQFAEAGLIGVDMPSGRTIPLRQFERAGAADTELAPTAAHTGDGVFGSDSLPTSRVTPDDPGQPVAPTGAPSPIGTESTEMAATDPFDGGFSTPTPGDATEISGFGTTAFTGSDSFGFVEPTGTPTGTATEPTATATDATATPSPTGSSTAPTSPFGEATGTSVFGDMTGVPTAPASPPTGAPSTPSGIPSTPTGVPSTPSGIPSGPTGPPSGPPSGPGQQPPPPLRFDLGPRARRDDDELSFDDAAPETPLFENPIAQLFGGQL